MLVLYLNKIILCYYSNNFKAMYQDKNSRYIGFILNEQGKPYETYITPSGREISFHYSLIRADTPLEIVLKPYNPYSIYKLKAYLGHLNDATE